MTVAKDARHKLQSALEKHVKRLIQDGITAANLVRNRQIQNSIDIRVSQSRGSDASLRAFLNAARTERQAGDAEEIVNALEDAYHLSKYLVKKVASIHWVTSYCPGLDSQTSGVGHMSKVKHSAKFSMASKA